MFKGCLEIFYCTSMSTFKNQLDFWKSPLIFVRYFVIAFLQTFRKCFKMMDAHHECPHAMTLQSQVGSKFCIQKEQTKFMKLLKHEFKSASTWKSTWGRVWSFVFLYCSTTYWFRVPLWQMQASCISLGYDHNQMNQKWRRTQGL